MVVRSLEYYQFRLVRETLAEREVLLHIAPHLVRPLQFVLPHVNTIRPAWLVRLGLFLYDHLGLHPSLPNSTALELRYVAARRPVRDGIRKGFTYYDCWVDDARLVAENAVNAVQLGARIMTNTTLTAAQRSIANGRLVYSTGLAKARCSYAPGP
jgi:glycerol-3-phosphate dehydrogenase